MPHNDIISSTDIENIDIDIDLLFDQLAPLPEQTNDITNQESVSRLNMKLEKFMNVNTEPSALFEMIELSEQLYATKEREEEKEKLYKKELLEKEIEMIELSEQLYATKEREQEKEKLYKKELFEKEIEIRQLSEELYATKKRKKNVRNNHEL